MKMAPGEIALGAGEPYTWDESVEVPIPVQQIWREVGLGIDKSQTVVWKNAVESLDASNRFLAPRYRNSHGVLLRDTCTKLLEFSYRANSL